MSHTDDPRWDTSADKHAAMGIVLALIHGMREIIFLENRSPEEVRDHLANMAEHVAQQEFGADWLPFVVHVQAHLHASRKRDQS